MTDDLETLTPLEVAVLGIRAFIESTGEDARSGSLVGTPKRVVTAWRELTLGYQVDIPALLATTFDVHADQLIVVTGIRVVSLCEHHLLPFTGTASVGYLPSRGRVIGLSKLPRLVDAYARRLQVQERLTEQVAQAIEDYLDPLGVGVLVRAHHSCLGLRGATQPTAIMTTSALRGVLLDKPEARAEFMALAVNGS